MSFLDVTIVDKWMQQQRQLSPIESNASLNG
jgi:hypothetical protein